MSMCSFCLGDSIRDMSVNHEVFCCYECYDRKYSLECDDKDE